MPKLALHVARHYALVSLTLPTASPLYLTDDEARELAAALTAAADSPGIERRALLTLPLPGACLSAARNTRPADF